MADASPVSAVLVYDGDCGFCTRVASWVARRPGLRAGVRVVTSVSIDPAAVGLTRRQLDEAAWWLAAGSEPLGGARAVAAALRACGKPWAYVGLALDVRMVRPLARHGYLWVAANRHRLPSGNGVCGLPRSSRRV